VDKPLATDPIVVPIANPACCFFGVVMTAFLCAKLVETHAACGFPAFFAADFLVIRVELWGQESVSAY
jgi:hypothetical protein